MMGEGVNGADLFAGRIDDVRIYKRALSASEMATLGNGAQASGSGYYVLGSALDVNGNLGLYDSTLDVSTANYGINVAGDWINNGNLVARGGTVTLDAGAGIAQTMSGNTVFNNLTKTVTTASALFLDYRARQNMSGALTLRGVARTCSVYEVPRQGAHRTCSWMEMRGAR